MNTGSGGWFPALIWVTLGTLFMGAVHDFGALVISLRHRGHSMGDIAGDVISPRVRSLFLLIISFLIWIVLAVFQKKADFFQKTVNQVFHSFVKILHIRYYS